MAEDVPLQLFPPLGLCLVPKASVTIDVSIPEVRTIGASISNWELMEKLKQVVQPEEFVSLRVDLCSREKLTFKGYLSSMRAHGKVILMLNGKKMKVHGFSECLRVKAFSSDVYHPKKTDWDGYYRSKGLDVFSDGHPGERPDTVSIKGIPVKWFVAADDPDSGGRPSELFLSQTFERYGRVDAVGVYLAEGADSLGHAGSFASFGPSAHLNEPTFEAYIRYAEYENFCSAMLGLKGMKMMRSAEGEQTVEVEVDYDRSGFMTVENVRRRRLEESRRREALRRARLALEEQQRQEEERLKEMKRKDREEKELQRAAKKKQEKLIIKRLKELTAQRKVEAGRLLRVLLAGAAEEVYQLEKRRGEIPCAPCCSSEQSASSRKLKEQVMELDLRKRTIECELKQRKRSRKSRH